MRTVFLRGAEDDLKELRRYIVRNFGATVWMDTLAQVKQAVSMITSFPLHGAMPEELSELGLSQYRQVICGKNRIIYEIREKTIYIHLICDARREMRKLLARRLLRVVV